MQSISSLKFLKPYLQKQKIKVLIMLISLAVTSSSILVFSRYLSYVIDNFFSNSLNPEFLKFFIFQNALILLLAIGTAARYYFTASIGENVASNIKKDMFAHSMWLSPAYFEVNKTGDILSQIQNDTLIIQNLIGSNMSVALRNLVMFLGAGVMLVSMSSKLTLFIVVLTPIIVIPIIIFGRKIKKLSKESQIQQGLLTSVCEESIHSIKTIQSYCSERSEIDKCQASIQSGLTTSLRLARARALLTFAVIFLIFCGVGLILWYGGYDVVNGQMSPGELSSFVFLAVVCAGSIGGLAEISGEIIKSAVACERAAAFLELKPDIKELPNALDLHNTRFKDIEFRNVSFSYPSKKDIFVLKNLSFTIKANEKIAIVGKSGAGKSTILQLLMRFYDVDNGEILFNNIALKNANIKSLRGKFAYIPQDPTIFSGTIYDNILFGNPQANYDEVINAAKIAAVDEFASKLPHRYNSFVGQKGIMLSGGQKQRIALARAILKNSEILLLDEATSSLDYENEAIVKEAISIVSKNRVTITVAHRLSTVINADRIFVISDGGLVEEGSHQELIANHGPYFNLISLGNIL
ncbi:ABC transporter ATP-binding protein [Candidatus Bandiella euplotis]|uniref:ABC transporter ATP-binding/permease protein n=1 Tax=Candidatus Bandiella euplotis TaxID=1664265 RepID=A0ABZ0UPJ3_9RICK|nr:ABC transporter transmembrane domain-containing protein [Candidatus Bandiella woodruffii]WPX96795.1 ABC transporter ATP-binding/permease protein [Candidatus Bandiella woodruffii]